MYINTKLIFFLSCFIALPAFGQSGKLTDYVNPFVGTDGYGNVYPGSQIPFGGIQISPDTDADFYDAASGYKYSHPTIMGFSLTHLSGTGIPDLGDFLFIPGTGKQSHQRIAEISEFFIADCADYFRYPDTLQTTTKKTAQSFPPRKSGLRIHPLNLKIVTLHPSIYNDNHTKNQRTISFFIFSSK